MSFLTPGFLFLTSLASIPIIIHLIQRIRLKKIQYSSLFFLTETKRETFSWIKLKEILLLIFRTLFIFFLFFALARPFLRKTILANNYEAARIIVLDDSYSMMNHTTFSQAKLQAMKLINELKKGSEAAILTSSQYFCTDLTVDLKSLTNLIDTLSVSYLANNLETSFSDAVNLLNNSSLPRKEIFIITDLQKNSFSPIIKSINSLKDKLNIIVVDVGKKNSENVGIEEIFLYPNLASQDFPSKPQVRIRNYSNKSVERTLNFSIKYSDAESLLQYIKTNLSLGPLEIKTIPIDFEIRIPGSYKLEVSLSFDSLPADDVRYLLATIQERTPILLVFEDSLDIQYVKKVLELSHFDVVTAHTNMLRQLNLKKYQAIGLFSPASLSYADFGRISYYLLDGGGLFIVVDEKIKEQEWSNLLNINQRFTGKQVIQKTPNFVTIGQINYQHPITEIFRDIDLSTAKFSKYWALDSISNINVLASFSSQKPFLAEGKNNKIIIAFTSFKVNNTDFMFKATFLPLIHRIFTYLASPIFSQQYHVNDTVLVQVDKSMPIKITTPDGEFFILPTIQQGRLLIKFSDTKKPGFYRIDKECFSVNVVAMEGDLTRITNNEIKNQNVKIINDYSGKISDLTPLSLVLALIFFIAEIVLLIL